MEVIFSNLALDMQIAIVIVELYHILLVKSLEKGAVLIPYYYQENVYVANLSFAAIRSFIKQEIIMIFRADVEEDGKKISKPERFSRYIVSDADRKNYRNIGFSNRLVKNVITNIQDMAHLIVDELTFDAEPYKINILNGVLDLRTGKPSEHTPTLLFRNRINAKYSVWIDEDEEKPREHFKTPALFLKVIRDALYDKTKTKEENESIVDSFLGFLASFLIGRNEHKVFYIILGSPNTGKSTLLEVLLAIFDGYGITINNTAFIDSLRTGNDIRPDLIPINGKRFISCSEANKNVKFDNALVKQVAGNDEISIRKPHKGDMVTFTVVGKVILVTNYCPNFSDLDDTAFLNRIVLVDFNNIPENLDTTLKNKLLESDSRDAIFTFLAKRAMKMIRRNEFIVHERFKANKQRILINQNSTVSLFWKAHIRPYKVCDRLAGMMPRHFVQKLYAAMYVDYCERNNLTPLSLEAFAKEFKRIADTYTVITHKKGESNMFYLGFDVVDGNVNTYNRFLMMNEWDKSYVEPRNQQFS